MAIADIFKGDTKAYKFTFVDINKTPIDITGWHIWFTAKAYEDDIDADAVIQVDATAGDDVLDDPTNGVMYVVLTSTLTNIVPQALHYDFKRVIPGNPPNIKTLDKGTFSITKVVTLST